MKEFIINILRGTKGIKNPLVALLNTFLSISANEAFEYANSFRKILGLSPIKAKTVKIEETISDLNAAYHDRELAILKMRAEYKDLCTTNHEVEHRYYNHIALGCCKSQKKSDVIPPITFEDDIEKEPYGLDKDINDFKYASHVPDASTPDEEEVILHLDDSIHDGACQIMSVNESQFRTGSSIKPLPKVIREKPKVPLCENIKAYMTGLTILFVKGSILMIYVAEGIILQNVFHKNLGFSEPKSWLCATMIFGVTYVVSRVLFGLVQRLLERTRKHPILIAIFSILFFAQIFGAGLLTNYNIRRDKAKAELKSEMLRLGRLESALEDSYDVDPELQAQTTNLRSEINERSIKLKEEPSWVYWLSYALVGLFSVLTLFASCILKNIAEQGKYIAKLRKTLHRNNRRILEIEETYDKEVERLLSAGVERKLFRYHLARKYFIEKLLTQGNSLDKQAYLKAYRKKSNTPFSDVLNGNGVTTHHKTINTNF